MRWRESTSRRREARKSSRWALTCSRMRSGESTVTRAAASSIARGMPSRRSHSSATAALFRSVSSKMGNTAWARSTKREMLGTARRSEGARAPPEVGSGASWNSCSASMRSFCREVPSTFTSGARTSSARTPAAPASASCSKLSRISSVPGREASASATWSSTSRPSTGANSRPRSSTSASRAGSARSARERNTAFRISPSSTTRRAASSRARRVLPAPPGPVNVTSRVRGAASMAESCAISNSRPKNCVVVSSANSSPRRRTPGSGGSGAEDCGGGPVWGV